MMKASAPGIIGADTPWISPGGRHSYESAARRAPKMAGQLALDQRGSRGDWTHRAARRNSTDSGLPLNGLRLYGGGSDRR
jgi:hypothetical protein